MFHISKLLNKTRFTGIISKYVDLIDYTIKNGYLFNKYTDKIEDKYSVFDIISGKNYMLLSKMVYLNTNRQNLYTREYQSWNTILQDTDNFNIFYFMSNDNTPKIYICDIKEKRLDFVRLQTGNDCLSNFIGQDSEFVYFFSHYYNGSDNKNGYTKIEKLDKKTHLIAQSTLGTFQGDFPYVEKGQYDNTVIFYNTYRNYFYIHKVDLIEGKTFSQYKNISGNEEGYSSSVFQSGQQQKYIYFVTNNGVYSNNDTSNTYFHFYRYDKKQDTLEELTIDKNVLTRMRYYYYQFRTYSIKRNGKEYLIFAPTVQNEYRDYGEKYPNNEYSDCIRMYLFQVNDNNLTLIDEMESQSVTYTNLFFQEDTELFIWGNYKHINFIRIDDDLRFESIYIHNGVFENFGINSQNEIFIQNYDSSIDKLDRGNDVVVKCKFEKTICRYDGIAINSFMEVEIKNFLGEYLKKDIVLTLVGNITFDDGSKTKETTTSSTGKLRIPIIIKTNTQFDCNIKIKEK